VCVQLELFLCFFVCAGFFADVLNSSFGVCVCVYVYVRVCMYVCRQEEDRVLGEWKSLVYEYIYNIYLCVYVCVCVACE